MAVDSIEGLGRYLPRVLLGAEELPPFWAEDGSLLLADVSGFTRLSERLARAGKSGAEVLVDTISRTFTPLLQIGGSYGGDVLKFGGDALLIFFGGDGHLERGCAAADEMRRALLREGRLHVGSTTIRLGMSQGLHSGRFDFFLVGGAHQELVVAGPGATTTVEMEVAAGSHEVLVSAAAASRLDARLLGAAKAGGRLLQVAPQVGTVPSGQPAPWSAAAHLERFVPMALRGRLDTIVAESEHRQATVAFLGFQGVDALLAKHGPAEVHRRLDSLATSVVSAMEAHGVCVICTDVAADGGKFMLASGAPEAHEDAEERLLRAARAVLDIDHGLAVRVGVNRGHVYGGAVGAPFRFTYSTMGDVVNLASRVLSRAERGQLLATAAVVDRCRGRFEAEALPPFLVKGKSQPVRALAVGQPCRARAGPLSEHPFVGRRAEVARIQDAFSRAEQGHGSVIELVGPAGVGKSRLLQEATRSLRPSRRLVFQCEQYEANTAYFAARHLLFAALGIGVDASLEEVRTELCRHVSASAPDLEPWLPLVADVAGVAMPPTPQTLDLTARVRSQRLREVSRRLLDVTLGAGTLICVEDTLWMDDASTDLLVPLLATITQRGWLVCLTRRTVAGAPHLGFGYPADVIEVGPLSARESVALLEQSSEALSPHDADRLAAAAGGNPLFLLELAAARADGGDLESPPADVEAIVSSRLDRLAPADRRLLRYASVLGGQFPEEDLDTTLGDLLERPASDIDWDRLREFVQVEPDGTIRFLNELFRRVAYEALPFARRRGVHGLVGEALEALGGEERMALLSLHFSAAQRHEKAWRYSCAAGDQALRLYANLEAIELYRRALTSARHLRDLPRPVVARVHEALGDACEVTSQFAAAALAYAQARRALAAGDQLGHTRVMLKEGVVRDRMGRYPAAVRWYRRALRHLDGASLEGAAGLHAELLVGLAATRYRQGRLRDTADWAERAVAAARAAGHRAAEAHAYYLLDGALTDLGSSESGRYRSFALPIYEELGDLIGQANVLNNLGVNAYYEGRWEEALPLYERSREARVRAGDLVGAATAASNIAEILSDQGRTGEAEELFLDARRVFRSVGYPLGAAVATCNLGRTAARAERYDEAGALLHEALDGFREIGAEVCILEAQARIAELLLATGRTAEALERAEEALLRAAGADAVARTVLQRVRGVCLTALERPVEGRAALIASVQTAEGSGVVFELAISRWALAQVERQLGLPRAAERLADSQAVLAALEVRSLGAYRGYEHLVGAPAAPDAVADHPAPAVVMTKGAR